MRTAWANLDLDGRTSLEVVDGEGRVWVCGEPDPPGMDELRKRYQGRIQFCISDFKLKLGGPFRFSPQELVDWQKRGVVGFKGKSLAIL